MNPQPLIATHDVNSTSEWYQAVFGFESGHGGKDYERLLYKGRLVMQLHHWDVHDHPNIGDPDIESRGNGVLLWFQADDFNDVLSRVMKQNVIILEGPKVNKSANHREVWLRDPNGYVVVVASGYGDLG